MPVYRVRPGPDIPVWCATAVGWLFMYKKMTQPRYFKNKNQIDTIKPNTLWKLDGNYMIPADEDQNLAVFYKSHEDWFYEVETPKNLA